MKPDFFKILPSEIISNILLRLSVRSIAVSKCVCKAWLNLLETDDFIKSHFSKSVPALAFTMQTIDSNRLIVSELEEDELDPERRYDPLTKLDFPHEADIVGSANGLLFLFDLNHPSNSLYVCNPITREFCSFPNRGGCMYGFGASRVTGQHKVVCLEGGTVKLKCYVYTLGTGSWRCIEAKYPFGFSSACVLGTFLNGNLHWRVTSKAPDIQELISCFDLDTESFSSFTLPPLRRGILSRRLYTLRDSLSFCNELSDDGGGVVIWMMKEYGVEESWTKEYVITFNLGLRHRGICELEMVEPVKVFKNGDVLMLCNNYSGNKFMYYLKKRKMLCDHCNGNKFMYYLKKTKTVEEIGGSFGAGEQFCSISSLLLTPSLVSLKSICGLESVI